MITTSAEGREDTTSLRAVVAAAAVLAAAAAGCGGNANGAPAPRGTTAPGETALLEAVRAEGRLPVIVRLRTRGLGIRATQQKVIRLLAGTASRVTTRYERLPLLALVVDERGLRRLLASPLVRDVQRNVPDPPTG